MWFNRILAEFFSDMLSVTKKRTTVARRSL